MSEERMRILQMVAEGTITVDQAAQLIQALESPDEPEEAVEIFSEDVDPVDVFEPYEVLERPEALEEAPPAGGAEPTGPPATGYEPPAGSPMPDPPADISKWRRFWYLPLAAGVVVTAISGLLVFAGIQGSWHWFWMTCIWPLLFLGILIILFAWMSRTARWLHVRVNTGQDEWPRRIAISLPLPLRFAAWLMKTFGRFIPALDDVPLPIGEAILALETSLSPNDPLHVQVEDAGGERVEVYIG